MLRKRGRPAYDQDNLGTAELFEAASGRTLFERGDGVPLWVQLRHEIEAAIEKGGLAGDQRMPSEQALSQMFGVSRPVVRAAMAALAAEGRLVKIPRRGTFVAARRDEDVDFITANLSVFDDLLDKGHTVTTRTHRFEKAEASERERRFLMLPPGAEVLRIGRTYFRDGVALTLTDIALPAHKVPGMELLEMENRSIFGTIRARYGLSVQRSERWFKAAMPTAEQCATMGIAASSPVIAIESVAYAHDGAPLEYYDAILNSAAGRIHVRAEDAPQR